ncbi:MAG: hypothetical protein PVI97_13990 [Candidatus Thiodiazotropha sp.]|jgi:hypothetical protein
MTIVNFYVYDSDGAITRCGSAPDGMVGLQADEGETAAIGKANDSTQYVLDGIVTDKPEMPVTIDKADVSADGEDIVTISGVPTGALCRVGSLAEVSVDDGSVVLNFDEPGDYVVTLSLFPYLDYRVTISAT